MLFHKYTYRLVAAILCATFFVSFITGCSSVSNDEKELAYTISTDPKNLDPLIATDEQSRLIIANIFEGLTTLSENGIVVCGAAESYDVSQNDTLYTFYLRKDAKWSDGTALTAYDFYFTFQRMFTASTYSPNTVAYTSIKNSQAVLNEELDSSELGVKVMDNYTLQIELESANPNFLYLLAQPPAMPCNEDFFYSTNGKYGINSADVLSNGPYTLSSWKSSTYIILKENPTYTSQTTPDIPTVVIYINSDTDAEYSNLKSKKTQVAYISSAKIDAFSDKKYTKSEFWDTTWVLGFNNTNSTFSNIYIRIAFSYAFNQQWVADTVNNNISEAKFLINNTVTYNKRIFREVAGNTYGADYDISSAKAYLSYGLSQLGLTEMPKLTIYCPDNDIARAVMAKYQTNLQKNLAVFLNVLYLSDEDLNEMLCSGEFQMAVYPVKSTNDPLISMFAPFGCQNSKNYIGYHSEAYDNILSAINQTVEANEIVDLCKQAETTLMADYAFIPFSHEKSYFVVSNTISGLQNVQSMPYILFKNAYILENYS